MFFESCIHDKYIDILGIYWWLFSLPVTLTMFLQQEFGYGCQ